MSVPVMRHRLRQFRRLFVTPPEKPPVMKRCRRHQRAAMRRFHGLGHRREVTRHQRRQEWGQLQRVAMFEGQDQLARAVIVLQPGPDHRKWRRGLETGGAERVRQRMVERKPALPADRRAYRCQPVPAGRAQARALGKPSAQHALMRQDKVGCLLGKA